MLRLLARCIARLDRLFPPVRVGGRESGEAYSHWEYETGRSLLAEYAAHFGPLGGTTVLDIGCGLGGKTVAYAEAGARAVGVDIAPEHVTQSVSFALSRGAAVPFLVGDAGSLPFRDGTFDLVVANDAMEHFTDPRSALAELVRVVRPGGVIYLFFTPWGSPLGSHLYDYIRTPWCHLVFPERLLGAVLATVLERRGSADPAGEADSLIDAYHAELNRLTVRRYRKIVADTPGIEVVTEERRPPKFSFLSPLTRIPLLGELFTGTVISFLRKKQEGPGAE
jgi:SAM-dependent methyltransferase